MLHAFSVLQLFRLHSMAAVMHAFEWPECINSIDLVCCIAIADYRISVQPNRKLSKNKLTLSNGISFS